jgi:hypothetical protein
MGRNNIFEFCYMKMAAAAAAAAAVQNKITLEQRRNKTPQQAYFCVGRR